MVRRIALVLLLLPAFAGFRPPDLPAASKGVYRFGPDRGAVYAAAVRTLDGGVFSLTVGFRKAAEKRDNAGRRDRARELIHRLSDALRGFDERSAQITVGRIYVDTREVVLNVEVREGSELVALRSALAARLAAMPGVAFVGEPGMVSIE